MSKIKNPTNGLPVIHEFAADIDIGSRFHVVSVPAALSDEPVQIFQVFTADIQRMAAWLLSLSIETVVMKSTGNYWVPVFEVLESAGIDVIEPMPERLDLYLGGKLLRYAPICDTENVYWIMRCPYTAYVESAYPQTELVHHETD